MNTRHGICVLSCALISTFTQTAAAAEMPLEEIVVTARHREEKLQSIPLAVSVFDQSAILARGIDTLGDLQRFIPNTSIHAARGSSSTLTAYIRGIGQDDPLWGYEPGVGLYIDDVYIARPQGALLDIYDIERIEVLRGPQGTLYGKNTLGGAIKYVTRSLPLDQTHVHTSFTAGNYQQRDAIISASTPASENLALGAALASYYRDGFGVNHTSQRPVSDKDILAMRLSAEWKITDNWALDWSADVTQDNSNVRGAQRLTDSVLTGETPLRNPHDVRSNLSDTNFVKTEGSAATITGQLTDKLQLRSITAYREGKTDTNIDFDTLSISSFDVPAWYRDHQASEEIRINYEHNRWNVIAGTYFLDSDACGSFDIVIGEADARQTISGCVATKSTALFGHASYNITDALRVSLGVRATHDEKHADVFQSATISGNYGVSTDFSNNESWSHASPRLSIDYQLSSEIMLFASLSEGYKSGGFNMRANAAREAAIGRDATQPFDEETLGTFELGMKSEWLKSRIAANVTAFISNYNDIQITTSRFYDSDNNGSMDRSFTQVDNAGEADLSGIELEVRAVIMKEWEIKSTVGYLDTDIKQFTEYSTATGRAFNNSENRTLIDTPHWTASIENIFGIYDGDTGSLTLHINLHHRSEYYPENTNSMLIKQPSYNLWDLSLIHTRNDAPLTLAFNILNVTDEEYRVAGYNFPVAGGGESVITGFYGDPRTAAITAQYEW